MESNYMNIVLEKSLNMYLECKMNLLSLITNIFILQKERKK